MSTNLGNIYAYLMRSYGERYTITYSQPPTYLRNILGSNQLQNEKIILFYKENRCVPSTLDNIYTTPAKLKPLLKPGGFDDQLDLTGSPLKDDIGDVLINDDDDDHLLPQRMRMLLKPWTPEEEYHSGIPADKARSIISCSQDFQLGVDVKGGQGSVWFLCTCSDWRKIMCLQYEFTGMDRKGFSRGIITYEGVLKMKELTSCQPLMKSHLEIMVADGKKTCPVETYIENTYQIKENMSICCAWTTTTSLPSLIDLSLCDVTLKQSFHLSKGSNITEMFLNQLKILMSIRDDILVYKEFENSEVVREPVYRCGIGIEMNELHESINKLMIEISEIASNPCLECDIENVIEQAKVRPLDDLTDKLWEILKRCSSYKDLKTAFTVLFQCSARCNIVNTPLNKNRLAEIITELANRRLAIPCLSGSEPLELLLEIGLEKLYKDYEYVFVESKICSVNDLKHKFCSLTNSKNVETATPSVRKSLRNAVVHQESMEKRKTLLQADIKGKPTSGPVDVVGFKNSHFDEMESANSLARLWNIHCTLEHLLMIQINLNLNNVYYDVCNQLLSRKPQNIEAFNDSFVDTMEIQLSPCYVRQFLERMKPSSRRITMKSSNKLRQVHSTYYYNVDNVCPPNICEGLQIEENEFSKEGVYYHWLYRKLITPELF